ncbi:MAG: ROK family protein [Acidimicrobiia bacterium]
MDAQLAAGTALAVDIGGTKLAAGRVSTGGELLDRATVATPAGTGAAGDAERLWRSLAELVGRVRRGDEVVCGVGCGGPMSPDGETVSPLNIPAWRGFPLRARLAQLTGLPVHVDNDAKALARGEGWVGAARGETDYIAMVVSTGVGGGIVVDGRLLDGASGNAGHIGHVIVEPDGPRCGCGARGCLEAVASGSAIRAATGGHPADAPDDVRRRAGMHVGRAIASVVALLDLRLAAVAGSVALGYGDPFFTAAREELAARARLSYARGAGIVPAGLGEDGPLVGAAAVGWHGIGHRDPPRSRRRGVRETRW